MFKTKINKNIVCDFEDLFPNIIKCLNISINFSVFYNFFFLKSLLAERNSFHIFATRGIKHSVHRGGGRGGGGRVNIVLSQTNFKTLVNKNVIKPKIGEPPGNFS
jgi:hypothetical protein